jgi:hypothetical protein
LPNVYDQIKKGGWAGPVRHKGNMRDAYKSLIIETERKRPLRRFGHILKNWGVEGTDHIHLVYNRYQLWAVLIL